MQTKQLILEVLTTILQDNVGNRLTAAMANGLLATLDMELSKQESMQNALGNATLVKGTPDAPSE